jgi:hypothetical protein
MDKSEFSSELDWTHLSNIVNVYDSHCIKIFNQQRTSTILNTTSLESGEQSITKHPTALTACIVLAFSSFIKSLPAFYSLPRSTRNCLSKTNIRPLIFPNIYELNQSCYSESWQVKSR